MILLNTELQELRTTLCALNFFLSAETNVISVSSFEDIIWWSISLTWSVYVCQVRFNFSWFILVMKEISISILSIIKHKIYKNPLQNQNVNTWQITGHIWCQTNIPNNQLIQLIKLGYMHMLWILHCQVQCQTKDSLTLMNMRADTIINFPPNKENVERTFSWTIIK